VVVIFFYSSADGIQVKDICRRVLGLWCRYAEYRHRFSCPGQLTSLSSYRRDRA